MPSIAVGFPGRFLHVLNLFALLFFMLFAAPAWSQETKDNAAPPPVGEAAAAASGPAAKSAAAPSLDRAATESKSEQAEVARPLIILVIGIATVLGLIIGLKINAFIALITAAMLVSVLAVILLGAGTWAESISRVAAAFGSTAGAIGIVIAMAAVIGKCMLDSGAADRIVRAFLRLFGEKRSPVALMGSGFVLAVPVFFDTVFYLLVPLARSLYRSTQKNYLKYILAISAGGAITHTLVPPTPGPLVMASTLNFDVGIMILVGGLVALPAAVAGLVFAGWLDGRSNVPMRQVGSEPDPEPLPDELLPPLWLSLLPVLLPVLMISTNTVVETFTKQAIQAEIIESGPELSAETLRERVQDLLIDPTDLKTPNAKQLAMVAGYTNVFGNANFALLISTAIAIFVLYKQRGLNRAQMSSVVEFSLMSAGVIILITAAGGAFGAMLKVAKVGDAIQALFSVGDGGGLAMLVLAFAIASMLKIAQGSSTAAMIIGSSMLAGIASPETLGFHPVYLATSIGAGSLVGSWMNDSGFWIFAKMGGLTEVEALKSWTPLLVVLGVVSFVATIILSQVMPLTG